MEDNTRQPNKDYKEVEQTKRDSSVISPHNKEEKKLKMAEPPLWAKELPKLQDITVAINNSLDTFKKDCFNPFKEEILDRVTKIESDLNGLPARVSELESDLQKQSDLHAGELKKATDRIAVLEGQNQELWSKVSTLSAKIDDDRRWKGLVRQRVIELEDRSRRDNLVIDGLNDESKESSIDCEKKVVKYMKNSLKVENAEDISIGRVHRLGRFKEGKTRQTIVKFDKFKDREKVWSKRSKAPRGKALKENFSKETEKERSILFPIMKAARNLKYFAKLEGNKLIVSNENTGGDVNMSVTVDTLGKLPEELNPEKLFTPSDENSVLFYSKFSPHSNFYPCKFREDNTIFNSVEQYFVHHNAVSANDRVLANKVLNITDPAVIKSMGKGLTVDLDTAKEHMRKGMLLKYRQNALLRLQLLTTGNRDLGEANPHDSYWGIGMRMSDKNAFKKTAWKDNWTGRILMEVRDEIK